MAMPGPASCHFEPPISSVAFVAYYQSNPVSTRISMFGNGPRAPGYGEHRGIDVVPAEVVVASMDGVVNLHCTGTSIVFPA